MSDPVVEAVVIGKTCNLAGIVETKRRDSTRLAKVSRQMRGNRRGTAVADEDHPASSRARLPPNLSRSMEPPEAFLRQRRRIVQATDVIGQELRIGYLWGRFDIRPRAR